MAKTKAKIIFTADDYGCADEIDDGIMDAAKRGLINSIAAFPNGPNCKNSLARLLDLPASIGIGCHLTITSGKPLTDKGKRFADANGNFREFYALKREGTFSAKKRKEVKQDLAVEINAQIDRVENAGKKSGKSIDVKHLSSHHNSLTYFPEYMETVIEIASARSLKVRSSIITPKHKNKLFFLQLQMRSIDNLDLLDIAKMGEFSQHMDTWLQSYRASFVGKFPKMPDCIDGRHYGPMPFFNVRAGSIKQKAKKKAKKLKRALAKLAANDTVEFCFHLIADRHQSNPAALINNYKQSDYYGVSKAYFDSRIVELLSLKHLNFKNLTHWDKI